MYIPGLSGHYLLTGLSMTLDLTVLDMLQRGLFCLMRSYQYFKDSFPLQRSFKTSIFSFLSSFGKISCCFSDPCKYPFLKGIYSN